jgi:hypothetical protein
MRVEMRLGKEKSSNPYLKPTKRRCFYPTTDSSLAMG